MHSPLFKTVVKGAQLLGFIGCSVCFSIKLFAASPNDSSYVMQQQLQQLQQQEIKRLQTNNNAQPAPTALSAVPPSPLNTPDANKTAPVQVPPPGPVSNSTPNASPFADNTPPAPTETPASSTPLNEQAFNATASQLLPMTPDQVQRLRTIFNASQYAATTPVGVPPRPVATSLVANLSPGATPPVVRLQQGFVSSVVFLDETGAPWPIENYDVGNPQAFNIQWDKKGNTLLIQSQTLYTYGNLAVKLVGMNTPVMLTLLPGQKAVDYRADVHILAIGPNAKEIPSQGLPASESELLYTVLGGGAPQAGNITAKTLSVSGADAQAWILGGKLFLRTTLSVLSPGWMAMVSSADGTNAYEMKPTPVVLVSDHGKTVSLKIGGF